MSRKSLLIVLFVSLALNLFLVGALAGGLVVGQRLRAEHPPMMSRGGPQPLWRAGDALPPPQARAYRGALNGEGQEMREAMRAARSARQEAWRSMAAEPFDPVAAKQRLAAIRAQEADARGQVEEGIVDFAAGLSPADRAILAKGLTEQRQNHRPPPR